MSNNLQQSKGFEKTSFEPLPVGDYKARLIDFSIKPNKAGTGTNGTAQFEIINGDYKKRKVFHTFLIEHPNEKAVGYSNNRLNKFLAAAGEEDSIEDMGFAYEDIMDRAGEMPIILRLEQNEYVNRDGVSVVGNKITHFKSK